VAPQRNSRHWRNTVVTWGEILDWMAMPDNVKESGNYILGTLNPTPMVHNPEDGTCTRLHRNKKAIARRSALTLDLDYPSPALPETLDLTLGHAYVLHTTFSHTTVEPRYRLIIPLDREVDSEEYIVAARAVMQALGDDMFDPSTDQPERYMFKPAAAEPATFQSWVGEGGPAVADDLLADFNPDLSAKPMPKPGRGRRSPFELEGVVGAFNKAYDDFQVLIEEYELPYLTAGDGRWHLQGAASVAGMGVVGNTGFVYSHHVTDPAYGEVRSAFDLVRVHRFGYLDADVDARTPINKLPSYVAMQELASTDARAIRQMVGEDFTDEQGEFLEGAEWVAALERNPRSAALRDTVANWDLLREHDDVLKNVFFNVMSNAEETSVDLPWRTRDGLGAQIQTNDINEFIMYIERRYGNGFRPTKAVAETAIIGAARMRPRHPVEEYLKTLEWDGVPRLEDCLPTTPSPYSRMVARKCLVAAVARVFEPGVKWDHTLIFHGKEGLGKTYWMEKMSKGWHAPVGALHDKDTLMALQRCWIATSDEGGSMRKADVEALKEFLTRRVDTFRSPYDRTTVDHPRRCVVWGTTNDNVFLRKQEGNRRFLVIKVTEAVDFRAMPESYIDQVWAEAVHLYRSGEVLLWLDRSESAMAEAERASFIEEGDGLSGIIGRYLGTMFPDTWLRWDVARRQDWMQNREMLSKDGTLRLDEVCAAQIWTEALGRMYGTHTRTDLLNINRAMQNDLGWMPDGIRPVPGYGPNLVFKRPHLDALEDLL
jgi:predicted P-loop ATPase